MALKDLKLPTATVEIPGGSFAVRGLAPVEIELLVREHRATLGALFDQFKMQGQLELTEDVLESAAGLLVQAPELMARIISIAADEEDAFEQVLKLSTPIQFAALGHIAALTFSVEGDLGKLVATVIERVGGLNGILELVTKLLMAVAQKN